MTHLTSLPRWISALAIVLGVTSLVSAQEERVREYGRSRKDARVHGPRVPGGGNSARGAFGQGSRGTETRRVELTENVSKPMEEGFVFVDGVYVEAPYVFRTVKGITYVNDVRITPLPQPTIDPASVAAGPGERTRFGFKSRPFTRGFDLVHESLTDGAVMWIEKGEREFFHHTSTGFAFLKYVIGESESLSEFSVSHVPAKLRGWLSTYVPPPSLRDRATAQVRRMEHIWETEANAKSAQTLLDKIHYPMTLFGLLIAATAVGHMFTSWPSLVFQTEDAQLADRRARIVWRSMAFVLVLSLLDLVWTVLASRAGTMQELNPLAGRFISDPTMLTYFKIVATGLGVGLLVWLRRHHSAQTASLWLCLVCTLLTCRWLTYTSLFAS